MDRTRSALARVVVCAFLFLFFVSTKANARGPATEAGPVASFASQQEITSTLNALVQGAQNCSALQEVANYSPRSRRILSPSRLDGPHEPVEEGGPVKRLGDYLIVLHRQRLFSIAIQGGSLRSAGAVSALTVNTSLGPWSYEELLLVGDHIVLTGWSEEGLEIGIFDIDRSGRLTRTGMWHLRATMDCFSRSYASFVVDGKLVLYSWHELDVTDDVETLLPAIRKWTETDDEDEDVPYTPTARARDVYHKRLRGGGEDGTTLHTVTVCQIPSGSLRCDSTVLLGRAADEFHASADALYLWSAAASGGDEVLGGGRPEGVLYRMAYDGSSIGRVPVSGRPFDRDSFRSDRSDLQVLLTTTASTDDDQAQSVALLRVPVADLTRGRRLASSRYTALPPLRGGFGADRFAGDHVLYSFAASVEEGGEPFSRIVAANLADRSVRELKVSCLVTQIEAVGADILAAGAPTERHCGMSLTRLSASPPAVTTAHFDFPPDDHDRVDYKAFQYDSAPGPGSSGLIVVPMTTAEAPERKYLREQGSVAFLASEASVLRPMGSISSREQDVTDDVCAGSICDNWFSNAHAFFIGERILVLLGYELIEAKRAAGQIVETDRIHFAPADIFWPARVSRGR